MADKRLIDTNTLLFYHQGIKRFLGDKVDKVAGKSLISDEEIIRLSSIVNYNDKEVKDTISALQKSVEALESGTYDDTQLRADIASTYATIASLADYIKSNDLAAWAKASTKPSYTASEVGADPTGSASTALSDAKSYTDTEIKKVTDSLTTAMHYKGSVNAWSDLPTSPKIGDFYNIVTKSEHNNAGDNAAWNGSEWDVTSGVIDVSMMFDENDLATNEDITTILNS